MEISFEEVKQIFRESIDDSKNISELLQSVANKIYQKGFNDGIISNTSEIRFLKDMQAQLIKSIPEDVLGQMVSNVLPR